MNSCLIFKSKTSFAHTDKNQQHLQKRDSSHNVWLQQIPPRQCYHFDSKRYFSGHSANLTVGIYSTVGQRISTPDRGTSRCSKWVRDYPAGSHKHWGCESAWQRLDASWSSCQSTEEIMRLSDLWRCCSICACLISNESWKEKNHYECN